MSTADTYVRARIDPGTKVRAATREAIAELEAGKGQRFAGVEALMADLNADDWTPRPETPDDQSVRTRAITAAGRFASGRTDVALRHDDDLAAAFRQ